MQQTNLLWVSRCRRAERRFCLATGNPGRRSERNHGHPSICPPIFVRQSQANSVFRKVGVQVLEKWVSRFSLREGVCPGPGSSGTSISHASNGCSTPGTASTLSGPIRQGANRCRRTTGYGVRRVWLMCTYPNGGAMSSSPPPSRVAANCSSWSPTGGSAIHSA